VPDAPFRPAETAATATPITRPIAAPSAPAREEVTKPLDAERARLHVTVSRLAARLAFGDAVMDRYARNPTGAATLGA
jgi:hypothetical protein